MKSLRIGFSPLSVSRIRSGRRTAFSEAEHTDLPLTTSSSIVMSSRFRHAEPTPAGSIGLSLTTQS